VTRTPQKFSATDKQKFAHENELAQKKLLNFISVIPPCGTLL
jgi:hypothetical protein